MTEISVIAQEIAASRRRGIPADEGKLWETLRLDAERVAAGEEMLRGFLDLVVLRHDSFASGLGVLLARKLAECSVLAIDIHPAVSIGRGVFIDHGTGLVVGETAVIGDDVSILHEVTLGGTGKERGDRHPKVRDGVLLCAGAKVLGNVEIGHDAKVGAGSVVLQDVPPRATVAGVPARIVGWSSGSVPALEMDQSLPDYDAG
jgi:serine O-acetyltransferase